MSYSVEADIQKEFTGVNFAASGAKVTSDDITSWLADTDEIINAWIAGVYAVPVTASNGLALLKPISIDLVAFRVEQKLRIKSGASEVDKGRETNRNTRALKMLEKIQSGSIILRDADKATTHDGAAGFAASNTGIEHTFKKNVDQW